MSKIYLYAAVFAYLFMAGTFSMAYGEESSDPEAIYRQGLIEEKKDLKQALALFCEAARHGYGPAQLEIGKIYGSNPGKVKKGDSRRDIAATMMWLDMANINKIKEAAPLRRDIGKRAASSDFKLYSEFTRMEIDAPCLWNEIYPSEEVTP